MKYSKGPWVVMARTGLIQDLDIVVPREGTGPRQVAIVYSGVYCQANAERIVACVNALEGIDDPEKYLSDCRDLALGGKDLIAELERVVDERDTATQCLQELHEQLVTHWDRYTGLQRQVVEDILTKLKEAKQ